MEETWGWLSIPLGYWMVTYVIISFIFFFLAVISKKDARFFGIIAGACAIWSFLCLVVGVTGDTLWGIPQGGFMGLFQFTLSIIFIIMAFSLIYFAFDAKNNVGHKEAFYSALLLGGITFLLGICLLISAGILYIRDQIITTWHDFVPFHAHLYPPPIAKFVIVVILLVFFAIGAYCLIEMKTKSFETESAQKTDKFQKTFSKLDLEISRKIYHVIIIVVLVCYLFVGQIVLDSIYQFSSFGLPADPLLPPPEVVYDNVFVVGIIDFRAGHLLIIMAVTFVFIILLTTDFIRIKKYRYYPFKMLAKIYRDKERLVLAPHLYLTGGVLFIVIFSSGIDLWLNTPAGISAQIVAITVMVSALADALATIIGVTKGKHHLKGGKSKKIWEGWIAGFISAFILGFLSFLALMSQYGGTIFEGIILSLVAAIVFGLIDYFSPPISDNVLNPVLIGLTLWGVAFLFAL
ncbi:MAG: hypothetical protein HWN65_16300 [Candidatus Helarchaeota archaeon]|nr:hypothetical protein [Candidatus Helarchaeota archaeon]